MDKETHFPSEFYYPEDVTDENASFRYGVEEQTTKLQFIKRLKRSQKTLSEKQDQI